MCAQFAGLGEKCNRTPNVLAFFDCPKKDRTNLLWTNPLGVLNGEIRRRADVVGILPTEKSIHCLLGALLIEQGVGLGHPDFPRPNP